MPHYFVPPANIREHRFWLEPEESDHLARVLRKRPGDEIGVFDGQDHAWRAVLEVVSSRRVEGRLGTSVTAPPEAYRLRLFQALPKGDKLDWILEKGTELGVSEFWPMVTERSLAGERGASKAARWKRIVQAAAEQCGRARLPEVHSPVSWPEALAGLAGAQATWIAWEGESGQTFQAALRQFRRTPPAGPPVLNVMIGPEGGFSPVEIDAAVKGGAIPVSLGPRILRTETAALFAAAAILYEIALT